MDFTSAIKIIKENLNRIGSVISESTYDAIIVKKLSISNTLEENRTTNQSHIAITGAQMDMFPYVRADGYFEREYTKRDENLKQFFVAQIPIYIHKENVKYLNDEVNIFNAEELLVYASIVRSRRKDAPDQIQMSMLNIDSAEYIQYRKLVYAGYYMILLKRKNQLLYDLYTIKKEDAENSLDDINNGFFVLKEGALKTPVKLDQMIITGTDNKKNYYNTGINSAFPRNRIIFGAPGTGKSFKVNNEVKNLLLNGGEYERVTFHPDYSYANFVGTYKPVPYVNDDGKKGITYEYVPGPFSRVLVKAYKNAMSEDVPKPYVLVVEEINRANMAAVFGDVFQLLDRDGFNVSEYPICASEDMKEYLAKELGENKNNYNEIKLPDNMFIWATMNSADQGVFPMDTAFKRRWDFTYLGVNTNEAQIEDASLILGAGEYARVISWNELRKAINNKLLSFGVNEDKLMGTFFLTKNVLESIKQDGGKRLKEVFKNKVIMYLFDDAAKRKVSQLFSGCQKSNLYSEIVKEFEFKGVGIFDESIRNQFIEKPKAIGEDKS